MRHFTVKSALLSAVGLLLPGPAQGQQQYEAHNRTPASCPDYFEYSKEPHKPLSEGRLALPFMRPSPECRTFNSSAVEKVIRDIKSRLQDPDLARLFENTFASTLDTTVKYFDPKINLAFIVTGDIT
ncbi:hypothetical protein JDV02_010649 [Purpureocillium takamizusanense]|uniref:Uncharacterized protein n=1 Tax=Purpureocillium takamizusanense TaxID=2060973 RepID=A0A9Q8VGS4_9HYPO|nr:uncharacterized protein JDV02_010649 [Purpureocillium takamizusanense]UNI24933.1 hypothetical protein JDV02_010649 [Purpureocillium takamizusanense]